MGNNSTGKPRIIDSPAIQEVADRLGKTSAQVLIAWATHNGFCVIPKSLIASEMAVSVHSVTLSVVPSPDLMCPEQLRRL
jgi:L-glyceraldehyde reductase